MDPNRLKTTRFPVTHKVKSHPEPFQAVWSGVKGNEIRINDRRYKLSDSVRLMEFDPESGQLSGRTVDLIITHIRFSEGEGYPASAGLKPGYVSWDFLIVNQYTKDGARYNGPDEPFNSEGF